MFFFFVCFDVVFEYCGVEWIVYCEYFGVGVNDFLSVFLVYVFVWWFVDEGYVFIIIVVEVVVFGVF